MNGKKVLVVAGPTASGKTALSIHLARAVGGEIVSADSMQIYRGMDIGTAKASREEQALAVHHMLDVAAPDENYSVARYAEEAARCCEDIFARGKVPVITGGTGLYIDALLSGVTFGARDEDLSLREKLNEEYDAAGGAEMLRRLSEFDPERAAILHAADKKRIVRAFEVYLLSGETITEHDRKTKLIPPRYDSFFIIPGYRERSLLYKRIDDRVDAMVSAGLFEEVEELLSSGVPENATAMQAIGYKEPAAYFRGELNKDDAIAMIKQESRRYAKRQLTWLRRNEKLFWIRWSSSPDFSAARRLSTEYLHSFGL